jgi:DNA-binding CsgD family transcriptional regulator
MTEIARAHAGSAEDRRRLPSLRGPAPAEVAGRPGYSTVTLLHVAQAQVWAGDLHQAGDSVARLASAPLPAAWVPAAVHWLRGLIHEAYGHHDQALAELCAAERTAVGEMPFYQAHMLTDLGRVAERLGHPGAGAAMDQARQIYRRLGAVSYLGRLAAVPPPRAAEPHAEPEDAVPAALPAAVLPRPAPFTDRERDVLTLLLKGLSYAQISRELYITQSTVGYHLGNLYAKTGVTSRHQLTELARTHPGTFTITGS